jgi:hypothetical protein
MNETNTKSAIITAVLTGVVTIIAGVAVYWITTKEPALTYSVVGGPTLAGANGSKRIFVIEVRNTGRKEIPQTFVRIALPNGELSEIASEASPGVKLQEAKSQRQIELNADLLNPSDVVKVSFLASLVSTGSEPQVVVRAPGVTASAGSTDEKVEGMFGTKLFSSILMLFVAALSAAVSSLYLMLSRSKIAQRLGVSPRNKPSLDQAEVGAFVCGACHLYEEAERLRFGGTDTSYRGMADYLRHQAARANRDQLPRYEVALRALLLTGGISPNSVGAIVAAIRAVGGRDFADEELARLQELAIHEGVNPVAWREQIESYASRELAAA